MTSLEQKPGTSSLGTGAGTATPSRARGITIDEHDIRRAGRRLAAAFAVFATLDEELSKKLGKVGKSDPISMPIKLAQVFIYVALNPFCSVKQVEQFVGLTPSAARRNLKALGVTHDKKRPGYALIVAEQDPDNTSRTLYRTSKHGDMVVMELADRIT